jgi:hypothetical protein
MENRHYSGPQQACHYCYPLVLVNSEKNKGTLNRGARLCFSYGEDTRSMSLPTADDWPTVGWRAGCRCVQSSTFLASHSFLS